jgi:glycosyltransferase involved in cell wall biosynthesis
MWFVAPENDYRPLYDLPKPEPTLRVAVCMPVYNRVDLLARTVAALVPQTYPADLIEVVVGDDGSDEDVESAIAPFRQRLRITVERREHDGYGAGQARNLAARTATGADVLVFVDSDCLPDHDLVSRHAVWHHLAENLVIIGSRHGLDTTGFDTTSLADGSARLRTAVFGSEEPEEAAVRQTDHRRPLHRQTADQRHGDEAFRSLVSSNFSIRRDRFLEVGGFDETFKRWGFEDVELGWRCHVGGLFTVPEDRAIVYHQLQEDLWDPEGRRASMERNRGVARNKIPHSFYRKHTRGHIWEVPKVSVVVLPTIPGRLHELAEQVRGQAYTDWELVIAGGSDEATMVAEMNMADPRFRVLDGATGLDLVAAARGEHVAIVHGDAAFEPRALTELVGRLDMKRRLSSATAAYAIGENVYRDPDEKAGDRPGLGHRRVGGAGVPGHPASGLVEGPPRVNQPVSSARGARRLRRDLPQPPTDGGAQVPIPRRGGGEPAPDLHEPHHQAPTRGRLGRTRHRVRQGRGSVSSSPQARCRQGPAATPGPHRSAAGDPLRRVDRAREPRRRGLAAGHRGPARLGRRPDIQEG